MGTVNVLRIGLTGGIAAGKSTVSERLAELGAVVVDYDVLAHNVVEPGSPVLDEIARQFGAGSLNADGSLDRRWLASQVFGDDSPAGNRERLMAIEYPAIFALAQATEDAAIRRAGGDVLVVVHDVPLLVEVVDELPFSFDHVVTVEAPEKERVRRMIATRGMTAGEAVARINSQPTAARRLAISDTVVDSTRPRNAMLKQVDELYESWQREAEESSR
ncbi:dephospho-CoA kinase [Bifidobacterium choloepi]|uniref:Dephospho-CoA kinase n=1 Tax=Bifidobacterium choloepi TaxID=2614131 RepID=A0A6I5N9X1_9BIFI|nr:dephospho-CoA kinase [Bifidobacterium choloepi]NEG69300.1 dephospho-CoA kinase [Bifidobacterium choloepi]